MFSPEYLLFGDDLHCLWAAFVVVVCWCGCVLWFGVVRLTFGCWLHVVGRLVVLISCGCWLSILCDWLVTG